MRQVQATSKKQDPHPSSPPPPIRSPSVPPRREEKKEGHTCSVCLLWWWPGKDACLPVWSYLPLFWAPSPTGTPWVIEWPPPYLHPVLDLPTHPFSVRPAAAFFFGRRRCCWLSSFPSCPHLATVTSTTPHQHHSLEDESVPAEMEQGAA